MGVYGTGFGLTVDASGIGWFGNFGWGGEDYDPQPGASISRFSTSGGPLSGTGKTPLSGPKAPRSYIPMMRQTASAIDRAGNLRTVNNRKPNLTVDATVNPGGEGIVICVGLAPRR
ncbi:MAG TPA: hypothetical protein VFQ08_04635 [Gaiella sp.]|nr:hypothetical protein [Gaiella sp.]